MPSQKIPWGYKLLANSAMHPDPMLRLDEIIGCGQLATPAYSSVNSEYDFDSTHTEVLIDEDCSFSEETMTRSVPLKETSDFPANFRQTAEEV